MTASKKTISTNAYNNHLQHLLTHIIIKRNGVSRVKAGKLAKRIVGCIDPLFVRPLFACSSIHERLIIQDFSIGKVAGFYNHNVPKSLNKTILDIAYPESRSNA